MNKSESIGNLAKALAAVQGKLKPALKSSDNPFFKSKYADLNAVWDSCRDLLSENGLAVVQTNEPADMGVIVETVLLHESNEWISGQIFLPLAKHDPQGVGSAISYGRRYGLAAMIGIVSDVDDDGNAASQPQKKADDVTPRIQKAQTVLTELGVEIPKQDKGEAPMDYLRRLSDLYNKTNKEKAK